MSGSDDPKGAARIIALNRTLRAEAEVMAPVLAQALAPADPEALITLLVNRGPAFGIDAKGFGGEKWGALWEPYLRTLTPLPLGSVEAAFDAWNRCEMYPSDPGRHAFYPRPAELYTLALAHRNRLGQMQNRIRLAMEHVERQPKVISPEERQKVAEDFKALSASFRAKKSALFEQARPSVTARDEASRLRRAGVPINLGHTAARDAPGDEQEEAV